MGKVYIDHVLIAVRNLEKTAHTVNNLGFTSTLEGDHPGRGTHNKLIVLDGHYLEMISVKDESEVTLRLDLPAFLQSREGLYMLALGTLDIESSVATAKRNGVKVGRILQGNRIVDGQVGYAWHSAEIDHRYTPGTRTFLIQHETPFEDRYGIPGSINVHANAIMGINALTLAVDDLETSITQWSKILGKPILGIGNREREDGVRQARLDLGSCYVDLVSPVAKENLSQFLESHGSAPYEITLESASLKTTEKYFLEAGLSFTVSNNGTAITVSPLDLHGLRLNVIQKTTS